MDNKYIEQKISAIENSNFIHIPGPNPILVPGEKGAWDDGIMELCDVFKDEGKYYLYYHAKGNGENYRIGVAVAESPLGPFIKYENNPVLDLNNFGVSASDDAYIACGSIFKESYNEYYLFYSLQQKEDPHNFYIGLATANHPLGPWKKHGNNPIMKNFGYVGGITKKDGKYYMFNEYPNRVKADDYGTISVAVADHPEGPWTAYRDDPVLKVEDWGTWDDAGYSECSVKYDGTLFHMFYGGGKTNEVRIRSRESIGYAYSVDGKNFIKYSKNPVAHRENLAYGAAMAEVCFIQEYPYVYLYHTLRYSEVWNKDMETDFPRIEHIGAEVLCVADKFNVSYPVYEIESLSPCQASYDNKKLPLTVAEAKEFSLTVSCDYDCNATAPLKVSIHTGISDKSFDTIPYKSFTLDIVPDSKVQQTFTSEICAKFMKIVVENTDSDSTINNISVNIMLKN